MLTKTKRNHKNLKIENFAKCKKILWRYVSEKPQLAEDGRTDGRRSPAPRQ